MIERDVAQKNLLRLIYLFLSSSSWRSHHTCKQDTMIKEWSIYGYNDKPRLIQFEMHKQKGRPAFGESAFYRLYLYI